jgi:aminoglycoside phosphotransferase (APT) family kinase protein
MVPPASYPPAEADITPTLIRALLAEQHTDLSHLPLGEAFEGWDNVTTRLGSELAVRMPRLGASAPLLEREIEWLPRLSTPWSFGAPVPVRVGRPGHGYPWTWSVVPWFEGAEASDAPLSSAGAEDLGRALRQIHVPAPASAPTTPWRTTPLAARKEESDAHLEHVDALAAREGLDWNGDRARALWTSAAALPWTASHWVHADIHVKNLVTRGGRLAAILDWGEAGAGDPAQDVGQVWLVCDGDDAARALAAYGLIDEAMLERARGEALVTAVRLLSTGDPGFAASGWRGLVALGLASGPGPFLRNTA